MPDKVKIQAFKGVNRFATVENGATVGATIGVNVFNADGTLYDHTAGTSSTTTPPLAAGTSLDDVAGEVSTNTTTANTANTTANTAQGTATAAQNSAPIINPSFATGDLTGWTSDYGTWAFQSGTAGPETGTSTYAIRTGSTGTPTDTLRNTGKISVYAGAVVKAACSIRANGANGTCACLISWRDATGAEISVSQGNTVTGTTLAASFVTATAPANAIMAHIEAAAINHTTGTYTVDGFVAPILPDSLDQVPDSSSRFASPLSQAIILAGNTPGGNMCPNPMFALGMLNWAPGTGWGATSYLGEPIAAIALTGTASNSKLFSLNLPVGANVALSVGIDVFAGVTFTAGDVSADIQFRDSGNGSLGFSSRIFNISTTMSGFVRETLQNIVTPANTASIQVRIYTEGATGSGSIFVKRIKVEKGTVCTPWNDDATQFGNQLTNAGSGQQLGDQRNVPPIATANLRSKWSGQTISYSATAGSPAHATISVTAASLLNGGSPIAYNAMAVGVTGTGGTAVTYYLYCDDPTYAGGSQTMVATTNSNDVYGGLGRIYVGSCAVTFPTTGSGSGGGSGGGGACVAAGSFGPSGQLTADSTHVDTPEGSIPIRKLTVSPQKCVLVAFENGAVLQCSEDAPLMPGRVCAADALDHVLDTSSGPSRVCAVAEIGIRDVLAIDAGDVAFFAGESPYGPFALHHNKIIP